MAAIHQFVAGFARGDAISSEALVLRDLFRSWGFDSDIFCEVRRILPELRKTTRDAAAYPADCRPDDIVLLHLSIGSPVNDIFRGLRCRKALLYHNVTPPRYFEILQPEIAANLARGLRDVRALAGAAEVNLADSGFNARELEPYGYRDVRVLPLVLDLDKLTAAPDRGVLRALGDGKVNVLFVGRCVPNKKLEDLLSAFAVFQRTVEPHSRLIHAGSFAGTEAYHHLLVATAREWHLREVWFKGSVSQAQLNAYYAGAHLFLSMSEHEGFCIPLIESIVHDVPVLAYGAAAVPETLDGSGVLFEEKNYPLIAELMGRLVHDQSLRAAVLRGQRARLARYRQRDLGRELREHLAPLLPRA